MTTETSETQARAQLESIVAMVKRLETAESCDSMSREHLAAFDGAEFHNCIHCDDYTMLGMESSDGWLCHHCYCDADAAREAIEQDALSVEVRSGWMSPSDSNDTTPAEYKILLCWGGPAVRIIGELDEHGEPESARLEHQDWGTEWTEYKPSSEMEPAHSIHLADLRIKADEAMRSVLLTYARQFYYGS